MAIPDYQSIMLPLLKALGDGQEHGLSECVEKLAGHFKLTDEDKKTFYPSGGKLIFDDRVGWARTYLGKAGLVEAPGRGRIRLTERGRAVLAQNPPTVNDRFLLQFGEFVEFKRRNSTPGGNGAVLIEGTTTGVPAAPAEPTATPEDMLEASYLAIRQQLEQELLERIKKCSPKFFERLVVDMLLAMGYGGSRKDAGQAIGQSGDGGIDGIIKEDKLGLDAVYIQAKRWESVVGRPVVQAFAGSLEGQKARKGVIITTSHFSQDAKQYVNVIEKRIVLIDGPHLAQLLIDHNVGVTEMSSYTVKRVDLDYFADE